MSDNLKEWMLYADIILLSAWFGYGGKTIYRRPIGDYKNENRVKLSKEEWENERTRMC